MKSKVVHADAAPDAALPLEREALAMVDADLICAGATSPEEIVAAARDADALWADNAEISREVIAKLERCLTIVRYGIGYDSVDVCAATEHGILVVNIPGFCYEEVANHTIMFLLACAKKLVQLDRGMRVGDWPDNVNLEEELSPVGSIYNQQLGLVGLGGIARVVAVKAKALGLRVCATDPFVERKVFTECGVEQMALDELLETSDYVSLHVPVTDETRHMIDEHRVRQMQSSAFLINTSRGEVVDQAVLIRALQEGWIAGAALDVYQDEPLPQDSPLVKLDNVILTPHVASFSDAAFASLRRRVGEETARVLSGEWPTALVNPAVKGQSRFENRFHG